MEQPTQFLQLSTESSEPFIIPNVSPVSSPKLLAKSTTDEQEEERNISGKLPKMGMMMNILKPLVVISEKEEEEQEEEEEDAEKLIEDDAELISTRKLSILDLN
ncbi:hypothetical protein MG7_05837 [Candida albicans P34048]|nr:hypothetical protein MEO_05797 [Candida albicans P94015]KGU19116.1 hypothetical protein MG7_05837 [Candida albicans P34048]KGU21336.1 Hap43p-induced protein [Candida albicans P57055]KHC54538.1 Hap43p-induced protein [Candida albicans P75010]